MNFLYAKYLIFGGLLFSVLSCIYKPQASFDFNWLVNNWERTNNTGTEQTFENWKKINDTLYTGVGFTLSEKDTLFKENLSIFRANKTWTLRVEGVHETPVDFELQENKYRSFVAVNEQNPFPSIISYKLMKNGELHAVIANTEKEILFVFQQNKNL